MTNNSSRIYNDNSLLEYSSYEVQYSIDQDGDLEATTTLDTYLEYIYQPILNEGANLPLHQNVDLSDHNENSQDSAIVIVNENSIIESNNNNNESLANQSESSQILYQREDNSNSDMKWILIGLNIFGFLIQIVDFVNHNFFNNLVFNPIYFRFNRVQSNEIMAIPLNSFREIKEIEVQNEEIMEELLSENIPVEYNSELNCINIFDGKENNITEREMIAQGRMSNYLVFLNSNDPIKFNYDHSLKNVNLMEKPG